MCEPTPTSTIYSTSASLVSNVISTSSPIVITPPAITSTQTLSSCIGGNGVAAIAQGGGNAISKEDVQPSIVVASTTITIVQPISTSIPALNPAEVLNGGGRVVSSTSSGGSEPSGLDGVAGLVATGGGITLSISTSEITSAVTSTTIPPGSMTAIPPASMMESSDIPAASHIEAVQALADGGGREAMQNAHGKTSLVTSGNDTSHTQSSTDSYFGPVAAVGEGGGKVNSQTRSIPINAQSITPVSNAASSAAPSQTSRVSSSHMTARASSRQASMSRSGAVLSSPLNTSSVFAASDTRQTSEVISSTSLSVVSSRPSSRVTPPSSASPSDESVDSHTGSSMEVGVMAIGEGDSRVISSARDHAPSTTQSVTLSIELATTSVRHGAGRVSSDRAPIISTNPVPSDLAAATAQNKKTHGIAASSDISQGDKASVVPKASAVASGADLGKAGESPSSLPPSRLCEGSSSKTTATPASKPISHMPVKTSSPAVIRATSADGPHTSPLPAHAQRAKRAVNHRRAREAADNDDCQNWSTYYSTTVSTPDVYTSWSTEFVTSTSTSYVQVPISTLYQDCPATAATDAPAQATNPAAAIVTSGTAPGPTSKADKDLLSAVVHHITSTAIAPTPSVPAESLGSTQNIQPQVTPAKQTTTILKQLTTANGQVTTMTSVAIINVPTSAQAFDDNLPPSSIVTPASLTSAHTAGNSVTTAAPDQEGGGTTKIADTSSSYESAVINGTNSLAPANAGSTKSAAKPSYSQTSPTGTAQPDTKPASSNKGVSAGAAIGGMLALLLFIAGILSIVRWWLKRKRVQRTKELRSSWFYAGDVSGPIDEAVPSIVFGTHSEKRQSGQLQSRFSAPSTHTLNRLSRVVPTFLALPIKHICQGSGRFPGYLNNLRRSIQPSPRTLNTQFTLPNESTWGRQDTYTDLPPPIVPIPVRTPRDALEGNTRNLSSPDTRDHGFTPKYDLPDVTRSLLTSDSPPRLELGDTGRMSISKLDWGHSYTSSLNSLSSTSSQTHENSISSPIAVVSSATRSNPHLTPHVIVTAPTESYYSQPETLHSMYSQGDLTEMPIGQAYTAPGRVSPHEIRGFSSTYSYAFPMPPISQADSIASIHFPQTSVQQGRNLTNRQLSMAEHQGHDSSLFEYADYASRHGSMATTRYREDGELYDRGAWDGQGMSGDSIYGGSQQGQSRKSVKSVRWDDEEVEPRVFQLARAL